MKEQKAINYSKAIKSVIDGKYTIWEAADKFNVKPMGIYYIMNGTQNENKFNQFYKEQRANQ